MRVCDFCDEYKAGKCDLGLTLRKTMTCREFTPSIGQFCSDPLDFVNVGQIVQMAMYFGFQKMELKKIRAMATKEETAREQKRFDESLVAAARLN